MATLSDNEQSILFTEHLRGLVIIKSSVNKKNVIKIEKKKTLHQLMQRDQARTNGILWQNSWLQQFKKDLHCVFCSFLIGKNSC